MADDHGNGKREQIHLAGPSLLPLGTAVGITVALFGLTFAKPGDLASWGFVAFGGLIVLIAAVRWIRTVRDEVGSLPSGDRR
jgi:hypothetical protein